MRLPVLTASGDVLQPVIFAASCGVRFGSDGLLDSDVLIAPAWNNAFRETPSVGPIATCTPRYSGDAGCQATPPIDPSQRLDARFRAGSGVAARPGVDLSGSDFIPRLCRAGKTASVGRGNRPSRRVRGLIPGARAAMFSSASSSVQRAPAPSRRDPPMTAERPARRSKASLLLALTAAAAFGGFAATWVRETLQTPAQAAPASPSAVPMVAALPTAVDGQAMPSLAPMLQRVTPAVVSVHSKQRVRVSPFGNDPFFRRMFPDLTQERINESLGSGVIVDAQRGLVLTNHHVIEGADDVSVTLNDGRTLKAEFVGSDRDTDVALMRIPVEKLSALPLANSDQLRVGDFVVAVGNPFGFNQTVTSGIVSAVGRSGLPGMGFQNFIQTDASINPGNSGGALVNLRGELVGINTASFNLQGSAAGNIGLGFAIPTNLARNIMEQLLTGGAVRRGTLGIDTQTVDARIAQGLGLTDPRGAAVTRVYPGSSAAAAGLRIGDVIVGIDGQRIDDSAALRNYQGLQPVNAKVTLDVRREGKPLRISATLREQPREVAGDSLDPRLAGARFAELPESLRSQNMSGVLVEDVTRGSRAARNGLRKGDVILAGSIGEFADLGGFRANFSEASDPLVLRVWRNGRIGDLPMQ